MRRVWLFFLLTMIMCALAYGIQRFPPPEFETGYTIPYTATPPPRAAVWDWIDPAILFGAICLASYLTLKKRSRKWIVGLMIFSLLYFGFWRNGCVCSVGSIGNVALAAFDSGYAIPATVLMFFLLPLLFTLFFGRGFCAAVCPLGAMQDIVLVRPIRVPAAIETALRLFAYLYLAMAVLFAATGSAFLICRHDPFVTFFRFNGNWNLWVLGFSFIVISLFVGRPYCRFICPYGVILRNLGRLSKWRVTITPDDCIQCRLCEQACPFGAVTKPAKELPSAEYARSKRRIVFLIVLLPILAAAGGWIGAAAYPALAKMHPKVELAQRIQAEQTGPGKGETEASEAFRAAGGNIAALDAQAAAIREHFFFGTIAVGVFMGLVAGLKLISEAVYRRQKDYEAHRAGCFACGRCFAYCPREQSKRMEKV